MEFFQGRCAAIDGVYAKLLLIQPARSRIGAKRMVQVFAIVEAALFRSRSRYRYSQYPILNPIPNRNLILILCDD